MSKAGFTQPGIDRFHSVLSGHIESRNIPGLVALVSRHDELHVETLGQLSFERTAPMQRDSIFRIASITKPIAAAAAMILVEECRIRLDDPIDPWLPELANRRVLRSVASEIDDTIPAKRAITLRDLLTSTMGIGSIMAPPDTYPIQKYIREYRIGGDGPMLPSHSVTTDEWLKRLGSLPLLAQPGERWMYHVSLDTLGALIARVSGKSLATFLRERIFEPLGMQDTGFFVPSQKLDRMPDFYFKNSATHQVEHFDDPRNNAFAQPPAAESAGGGLVSTIDDYHAFLRMLLNSGRHRNEQILSRASVQLMTSDQVTPQQRAGAELFFGAHSSWGFGMAVDIARREIYHSPGRYGWTGGFGTTAYADPAHEVIGILFTQRMMDSPEPPKVFTDFWNSVYAMLE